MPHGLTIYFIAKILLALLSKDGVTVSGAVAGSMSHDAP
jgi:hypothetical protein